MKKLGMLLLLQCLVVFAFAQYTVNGTVKSENGEALAGASVLVKGTYNGTVTKSNGQFQFKGLKSTDYVLKVSFIGYEAKEVSFKLKSDKTLNVVLSENRMMTEEILVSATRAKSKMPVAFSSVSNEEIESMNMGQDIPYLLSMTPSFVTTSDAGAGVGYTNFRIRGTDLNRINVTVNGVPLNDAESHGTWWVDIPDLAASTDNIQIQRGVGTSTNGAAAFGATINLQTFTLNKEAYAEYSGSAGSYKTYRNSVRVGSGVINDKFTFDARLSKVTSDGFIDRASSDLKSFFVSAAYFTENTILKANIFSGFEETYQAWYGVPSVKLNNDETGMQRYLDHWLWSGSGRENEKRYDDLVNSDARTYNFYTYENEVDHYQQDHYQLHFSHKFSDYLNVNAALHYTYGRGYYEGYGYDEDYLDYGLEAPSEDATTDMVTRKWLDNDFYGFTYSLNYNKNKSAFTFGGGYNVYDGNHFGNIIWAQYAFNADKDYEWYRGTGLKKDFNVFGKYNYSLTDQINLYADLQYRHINYSIDGIDDDLRDLTQSHKFDFINPKLGIYYKPSDNQEAYLSYSRANREPNRSNYVDADPNGKQPTFETLNDFELGYTFKSSAFMASANIYFMSYQDQLVQTGEINDVGSAIMVNVDDSYRRGIEIQLGWKICKKLDWQLSTTFSKNKIENFTEYVDNWDTWGQESYDLGKTDLALSPELIANSQLNFKASDRLNFKLMSSYVGDQYIDNTSSEDRKLDAYFVNNLKVDFIVKQNFFEQMSINLLVNNLFNAEYETNAWVYSYIYGDERYKMDGYYPQAGTHFYIGINLKF